MSIPDEPPAEPQRPKSPWWHSPILWATLGAFAVGLLAGAALITPKTEGPGNTAACQEMADLYDEVIAVEFTVAEVLFATMESLAVVLIDGDGYDDVAEMIDDSTDEISDANDTVVALNPELDDAQDACLGASRW